MGRSGQRHIYIPTYSGQLRTPPHQSVNYKTHMKHHLICCRLDCMCYWQVLGCHRTKQDFPKKIGEKTTKIFYTSGFLAWALWWQIYNFLRILCIFKEKANALFDVRSIFTNWHLFHINYYNDWEEATSKIFGHKHNLKFEFLS